MTCGIVRILQMNEAMRFCKLKVIDLQENDITDKCTYSWSTDGVCWTSWTTYDNYELICSRTESDFYLKIRLFESFSRLELNGYVTECYNIYIDDTNIFLNNFCGDPNMFQPYNGLDCALQLQEQLSDSIVCMLGIPIYYIKIDPKAETADYTFKEYVLHNVVDIKQLKLMIPDGQMPSSNPKLAELDFDWEIDWETELSKNQFAAAFGDKAIPKSGDIIYIPMMKRLWEVNSAYDEKSEGLMWRSTTWKLALLKYTDSTNVATGDFGDIIDNWTGLTYENAFGKIERNEQERQTGASPLSAPAFAATNLTDIFMEDAVRKQYTKYDANIVDKTYNHRANIVSRNIYRFRNPNGCVTYQKGICGDEGTIMFIIETPGYIEDHIEREILTFGEIVVGLKYTDDKKFELSFNGLAATLELFTSYMVCLKWNRNNFSTELQVYGYKHREDIPVYRLRPEMYWFDFENPVCSLVGSYNNDFDMKDELLCQIHSFPLNITNIKYYNKYLEDTEFMKESVKYTTTHSACVINDLARPINSGHGYTIK